MNNQYIKILSCVLRIIGYKDNKNTFIQKFISLCLSQSILEMLAKLPNEKQITLKNIISSQKDREEIFQTLQQYFPKNLYEKILTDTTQKLFTEYIDTVMPTLTVNQKNSLLLYLSSVNN